MSKQFRDKVLFKIKRQVDDWKIKDYYAALSKNKHIGSVHVWWSETGYSIWLLKKVPDSPGIHRNVLYDKKGSLYKMQVKMEIENLITYTHWN